jgi:hypothetical protein
MVLLWSCFWRLQSHPEEVQSSRHSTCRLPGAGLTPCVSPARPAAA